MECLNRLLVSGMFKVFEPLAQEGLSSATSFFGLEKAGERFVLLMCSGEDA